MTRILVAAVFLQMLCSGIWAQNTLVDCNFNGGLACTALQNEMGAGLERWDLNQGGTPSSNTGPNVGSEGNDPNYIYVEATGKSRGATARLSSGELGVVGEVCVSFYYHMYGEEMGELELLLGGTEVWSESGDQGDVWNQHRETYVASSNLDKITFVAIRGDGYRSDIALDNILIYRGNCDSTPDTTPAPTRAPTAPSTNAPTARPTTPDSGSGTTPQEPAFPINRPNGLLDSDVRLTPTTVFVDHSPITCAVADVDFLPPNVIFMEWYFPNGTQIVADTPGFRITEKAWWANKTNSELGWWRTYLHMDAHLPYTLSGGYQCRIRYQIYPEVTLTSTLLFRQCAAGEFRCQRSGACVPCGSVCDNQNDCGDWEDEYLCNTLESPALNDPVCSYGFPAS